MNTPKKETEKKEQREYIYVANRHNIPGFGLLKPNTKIKVENSIQKESVRKFHHFFMPIKEAEIFKVLFDWDDFSKLPAFANLDPKEASEIIKKARAKKGKNNKE